MVHQLKCAANYFDDVVTGRKTFEVRNNDRDFHIGDYLALNELATNGVETGRSALFHVYYILDDPAYCLPGYVILGIEACDVTLVGVACEPTILEEGVPNGED